MKLLKTLTITIALLATLLCLRALQTPPKDYERLRSEAENLISQGSYSMGRELYEKVEREKLSVPEARWVRFRLADTLWRSEASTQTNDNTQSEKARLELEKLIQETAQGEDRDRVWVEAQESLGDFWWIRRNSRNWGAAWPHYQQALDWWAGSSDMELARKRYLKMVWTMAKPPAVEPFYNYGYYGNVIPIEVLENALKISVAANDQAHAHYLLAMTIRQQGGEWEQRQRVPEEFESALRGGRTTDWYDDALFYYGEWMAGQGRVIPLEDGQWRQEPDYAKALELFRRLASEYQKGETQYYDQAQQQIREITGPVLALTVSNVFLPGSEIQYSLNWRNIDQVGLSLYRIDLVRDIHFSEKREFNQEWFQDVDLSSATPLKSWSKRIEAKNPHAPGQESLRLTERLSPGAYILEARGNGKGTRDLVLVSDASLVLKASENRVLLYFCDALSGAPIPNASTRLLQGSFSSPVQRWVWRSLTGQTNQDGIAVFDLPPTRESRNLFAVARSGDRQAFSPGYANPVWRNSQPWHIYAFTDRPAYRPKETVQWKFIARRTSGETYSTPAHQILEYEIRDPRGTKIKEDKVNLNTYGSAWGSLELTESMPLGSYQVNFWDTGRQHHVGSAALFRLEEYKLPEFKVGIQIPTEEQPGQPKEPARRKAFRLGDRVEVNIQADYYFGGPVSNASVEIVVQQRPFYHVWFPHRDYPWFYEEFSAQYRRPFGGEGQVIKRETLRTDTTGKASLFFETPRDAQQDFEYHIEARVTDASRRGIIASDTIRVTRQRYYVYPRPEHNLYQPQDKVSIAIKTLDANDQPLPAEGHVKLTRDYWYEIWIDPEGKEFQGESLRHLQQENRIFPPLPPPGKRPWRLKFRGYQHDDILARQVRTDATGEAQFIFTPEREGYYRMSWNSEDPGHAPIRAETTVWVARNNSTELGYRHGGLEIIADKDTFQAGRTAPVMISVPTPDRYVLFSVEGENLYDYQLVHVTGTVKLLQLPVQEKHVPNIFLSGTMVSGRQIFVDTKQVVVPPLQHFLTVAVKPDRSQYQPQEEGILEITTLDSDGKPVSAEVSLGVADESVYYIQGETAGDPRQFYYGSKRSLQVNMQSTFNVKSYVKLVEDWDKQIVDERWLQEKDRRSALGLLDADVGQGGVTGIGLESSTSSEFKMRGGVVGGVVTGLMGSKPAATPMAMAKSAHLMRSEERADSSMAADQVRQVAETEEPVVQVRSDFRTTILWKPDAITNSEGKASLQVKYPDSLTGWKATVRAVTEGNQFGIANSLTRTQKPLIVRLQAPRFFLAGDEVTVSAVINNNTDGPLNVLPAIEAEGLDLLNTSAVSASGVAKAPPVVIPANGESRVDWSASVRKAGTAKLKVTARGGKYADGMEKEFLVYEHGIEKFVSKSGKLKGDEAVVKLDLPRERKPESTSLLVQVTPSLAVTMLDALPYLIDYPYGCTEQTMSRFLPAAIVARTLKELGVKPEFIANRLFGGIVPEHASETHPKGRKDLSELDKMIRQGLDRLYDFQHADGGWGWWKEGESDHYMSAYVVWGLSLARQAQIPLQAGVLERALDYLRKELVEEENQPDHQAWMLHALAAYHASAELASVGRFEERAYDNLWGQRDQLNAYTRALLALSAHYYGHHDQAKVLVQNLQNGVKRDSKPDVSVILRGEQHSQDGVMGTAHWGEDSISWRWSEGAVEATAFALRAILAIDPQNPLVESVTNWLIKNRRGAQWSNTRDTAIAVLAFTDYLRRSGEVTMEAEYELKVNGTTVLSQKLSAAEVFSAPSHVSVNRHLLRDGANEIRLIRKSGQAPLYFAAHAQYFSLEEPIPATGSEIFARRQYYRLTNRPTLLKGFVTGREPSISGSLLRSGDRVEVILTLEAKNDYEYLVFEDLKPAGLEAVQVRSGDSLFARELKSGAVEHRKFDQVSPTSSMEAENFTGRSRRVYQELRDRKIALFIDKLPQGVWEIRYELRAEVPGQFHALPVLGHAMYVPEIRCNGEETRVVVKD